MTRFGRDRALASGILIFFGILIVAAGVFIVLNSALVDVDTAASDYTSDTDAQNHINLLIEDIWNGILVFVLFVAALFLIARAVLESRRPG